MTIPFFPVLSGQGWSVLKKPVFATTVVPHVSGREVRYSAYGDPLWEFEVNWDGLDSGALYPGLGAQSMQTLLGFYMGRAGQFSTFQYLDPTDYVVTNQAFGVTNGTQTAFQLVRILGGFVQSVASPLNPAIPTQVLLPGSSLFAPNNLIANSATLSGATTSNMTVSGPVADPFGGTTASTLTATAAGGWFQEGSTYSGYVNVVGSVWLRRRSGSGTVSLKASDGSLTPVALTGSWHRFSVASSATGYGYVAVILSTNADQVDVCAPQVEYSTVSTPGPYYATAASIYLGGPYITVGGILADPSTYTVGSTGVITFTTAPTAGQTLAWTGMFAYLCRFVDDNLQLEQFMNNLWKADSVKFRSVRAY